ncbi:MAG: FkbM family methyltransferase, partial [Gemmatimonadaceae bacterium]
PKSEPKPAHAHPSVEALTPWFSAGLAHLALQRCVSALPRGRGRIARALAGRLRKKFIARVPPSQLGIQLAIDPSDPFQLEIWLGAYQPHVVSFLVNTVRPGSTVLCAGLQVGYVAGIARRLAGPSGLVLSAEPDPTALAWGRHNLALANERRDAPIHVLEGGLSDAAGQMDLYHSGMMGQSSFAAPHHADGVVRARLERGDEWLRSLGVEHVNVMVLDVEGWEVHALAGLTETIARSRDMTALVECSSWALKDAGSSPTELLGFFRDRGFEVRWARDQSRVFPCGVWGPIAESGDEAVANDIVCIRQREPMVPSAMINANRRSATSRPTG